MTWRAPLSEYTGVLVDFDGPICDLFAGVHVDVITEQLLDELRRHDGVVPAELARTGGPHEVLTYAASVSQHLAHELDELLQHHERTAALLARPAPGADALLARLAQHGTPAAIVSNNSSAAIETFFDTVGWPRRHAIFGRDPSDPDLMKPHPYLVQLAAMHLDVRPQHCVLLGDSVSDVRAAHAAGAGVIGYATASDRANALQAAGAEVIVTDLGALV